MKICPKCSCRIGIDSLPCPNGCVIPQPIEEMRRILQDIINGCVHPEIASRRMMVDLKPIREILKKYEANL